MPGLEQTRDKSHPLKPWVVVFRFGVAFLVLDVEYTASKPERYEFFNSLLELNKTVNEKTSDIFADLLGTMPGLDDAQSSCSSDSRGVLVHTAVEVEAREFFQSEQNEMIYKLCNFMTWDQVYFASNYIDSMADRMYLDLGPDVTFGFCKSGGALLLIDDTIQELNDFSQDKAKKRRETLLQDFQNSNFWLFLLAVHQRYILLRFSHALAQYGSAGASKKIQGLRKQLLEFTTQAWFSQVSYEEMDMEIYRKWQGILENQILFEEVFTELEAVDEYNTQGVSNSYQLLSVIFFPVVIFTTIWQSGLVQILSQNYQWSLTTIAAYLCIILICVSVYVIYGDTIKRWRRGGSKHDQMVNETVETGEDRLQSDPIQFTDESL